MICAMQKWLDYYGPFEAVVDAANVGLYSHRNFRPLQAGFLVPVAVVRDIKKLIC